MMVKTVAPYLRLNPLVSYNHFCAVRACNLFSLYLLYKSIFLLFLLCRAVTPKVADIIMMLKLCQMVHLAK